MFAGLVGLELHSHSSLHRSEVTQQGGSGRASGSVGNTTRKRPLLHKRPGFTRGERQQDSTLQKCSHGDDDDDDDNDGRGALWNGKSTSDATSHSKNSVNQAHKHSSRSSHMDITSSTTSAPSPMTCNDDKLLISKPEVARTNPKSLTFETSFNSSFSFIQQSLNCSQDLHILPEPLNNASSSLAKLEQSNHSSAVHSSCGDVKDEFWGDGLWSTGSGTMHGSDFPDVDARSVDTEVTSSLSVDSDSASSVTSGYESGTQASSAEHGLVKKYEQLLQECLRNNRAHTKIQSMMLKLQRLQQKAVQDDDYDAAERFGKKLEELCLERSSLTLGLPSRHPPVERFLQKLSAVVNSALQRTDSAAQHRETAESEGSDQAPLQQRDRLIQEKRLIELEMSELQQRLSVLERRRRNLERQIQSQEEVAEFEDLETSVLKTYSASQIQDLSQTLQDLLSSHERSHITVSPPPAVLRLQEQEQALNLSIKEATAKVMMTQRLGSNLRRKVSETETQLVALHEAKLAAISGNDFCSAKQLKAEMKAVHQEKDRLEALTRRLQTLSSSSCEELNALKQQRQRLRHELEEEQAQHECRLKDNASKYVEQLEDRLQSYGCPGLERIWEADLEACHLFLRGLQLRTPSVSGSDSALSLTSDLSTHDPPRPKTDNDEEQDCAMLTALGGRWCPEANLQNSQFTKKLEEFLFCMEDNGPEDGVSESGAADLTEQCELISDRLMTLEEELQMAIHNRDQELTQSLEKEVQNVKATLQSMLAQLQTDEEEEDDDVVKLEDDDLMENGPEGEEEEEDEYFSDSWDI